MMYNEYPASNKATHPLHTNPLHDPMDTRTLLASTTCFLAMDICALS